MWAIEACFETLVEISYDNFDIFIETINPNYCQQ